MIKLEFPYPPSANHAYSYVHGRPVLTQEARAYRHAVRKIIVNQQFKPLLGPIAIRIDINPPDNRRRDIDNCLKSLFDALQHAGAFWDDNQIIVLHAIKHPPMEGGRVQVVISQTEDKLCQESL